MARPRPRPIGREGTLCSTSSTTSGRELDGDEASPDEPDGAQLMLEPSGEHPPTKAYKEALMKEGIPFTAFQVDDLDAEHKRLIGLGVEFRMQPKEAAGSKMATFDDTCGNLIMMYEEIQ